jgi:probable rRNA maturation factor
MIEINNTSKSKISEKLIKKVVEKFLKKYNKQNLDISIAFVGDRKIKDFNNKYRNKNQITDILSFEGDDELLGEIIINLQQIKRQAKRIGHSVQDELVFILVHGLLHLVGYTHETEKKKDDMIKIAEEFINKIKILKQ